MKPLASMRAVVRFELQRALSRTRILWWCVLAAFPVFITLLVSLVPRMISESIPREAWATILFLLGPMAVCMLGTFLYAAPAVSVELERKSWVYLAVRPHAPVAVLLGKYLVTVLWTATAAWIGLSLAIAIARPPGALEMWWAMARLIALSCPAYASVYLVLGTLFYKRAMMAGITYTLLFELAASFIPALVNKLTIQFRLRGLFLEWADVQLRTNDATLMQLLGDSPPAVHVVVLLAHTVFMLVAALWILRISEFTIADESTT